MWKPIALWAAVTLASLPAAADFAAGEFAFNRANYLEAFKEWEPLAQAGDAEAQFRVGELYRQGFGVPLDYIAAAEWYGRGAAQGHTESQFRLGWLHKLGRGLPQDFVRAREYFQQAADYNNPRAQFHLGTRYHEGQGVPKDNVLAHMWLNLASVGLKGKEFHNAAIQRQVVAGEMSAAEVQKAQRMAMEWRPKEAPKPAPPATAAEPEKPAAQTDAPAAPTPAAQPVAAPAKAAAPAAKGAQPVNPDSAAGKAQLEKLLGKQPRGQDKPLR